MSMALRTTALVLLIAALYSCSGGSAPRAEKAWVRPAPDGGTTAGYLELVNDSPTPLVVTGVEAGWCESAQMHETVHDGPRASMQELPSLTVAPRSRVSFRPGGKHVMLVGVRGSVTEGATVAFAFRLASGDTLGVLADVHR